MSLSYKQSDRLQTVDLADSRIEIVWVIFFNRGREYLSRDRLQPKLVITAAVRAGAEKNLCAPDRGTYNLSKYNFLVVVKNAMYLLYPFNLAMMEIF